MDRYRFKTKEEFIADGQWNLENNVPNLWNSQQAMNQYLGGVISPKYYEFIEKGVNFFIDSWEFKSSNCVLITEDKPTVVKLDSFPLTGCCASMTKELKNHLKHILHLKCDGAQPNDAVKIAWNGYSYWYVTIDSSKTEYTIEQLSPFFDEEKLIDGQWYCLPKVFGWYAKYDEKKSLINRRTYCSEYINDKEDYSSSGGAADFTGAVVAIEEVQQYLPDGHKDKFTNAHEEQQLILNKTIKNEKSSSKTISSSEINRSIQICKPNLTLSTGISIRGIGLKSSGSKIKLGNNNSYN